MQVPDASMTMLVMLGARRGQRCQRLATLRRDQRSLARPPI